MASQHQLIVNPALGGHIGYRGSIDFVPHSDVQLPLFMFAGQSEAVFRSIKHHSTENGPSTVAQITFDMAIPEQIVNNPFYTFRNICPTLRSLTNHTYKRIFLNSSPPKMSDPSNSSTAKSGV